MKRKDRGDAIVEVVALLLIAALVGGFFAYRARGGWRRYDDEAKHRLYQAAATTGDQAIVMDMYRRLGFMRGGGSFDAAALQKFASEHGAWAQRNIQFLIDELSSPAAAKAYWEKNK